MSDYHIPVMLHESIDELINNPDGVYVDVTFGGGGHAQEILNRLSAKGRLMVFDQDGEASQNSIEDERILFVPANFKFLYRYWKWSGLAKLDGIIADLGVSSHQFDVDYRGFSYRYTSELDMRMNQENPLKAQDVISNYSFEELKDVFSKYGEIRNSKKLARVILEVRSGQEIMTTTELNEILETVRVGDRNKYLAQVYQALRIEVNQEIQSLEMLLVDSLKVMKMKARFVVISYHSLEDRLVKRFFKSGRLDGQIPKDDYGHSLSPMKQLGKLILPSAEEQELNPRSKSAKMRVGKKIK